MNYRQLGKSDLRISEISFGCMSLQPNNPANVQLLRTAFDGGINYFDTADLYDKGKNEEIVGEAFKPIRDKVILATKVGNQWRKDGSGWNWNPRKEYILEAVDDSLKRLQTDYIDLYQLHGGTIEDPIDEAIEAFEILKEQGKIREYGISSIRPNVIREWAKRSNMASVMMQYSLLDRRPEEKALDFLLDHNISVVTRGSLAKGMLINKPAKDYLDYSESEIIKLQKVISETDNPFKSSLGFALNHKAIASAVVGIRTESQLEDILSIEDTGLNPEVYNRLANLLTPNKYTAHR